jgi:hypothetical protein
MIRPCRRAQHRILLEVPDIEMISSSPSRRTSYHYGTQGYPGGFSSFREGQYGNIHAEGFPAATYRMSPWVTASWQSSSLSSNKLKTSITMQDTGFDTCCMGYDRSSDGFLNFSAGSNGMLPPTKGSVTWVDQQRKGNDALSCMPVQVAMDGCSSMFNVQGHSLPDEPMQSEPLGFPGFDDIESWNQGFSMLVNDPLSFNHAGYYPFFS